MEKNNSEKKIYELHARICRALSHPKRSEMIDLFRGGKEWSTSDLAKKLNIRQANTSQHLAILRQEKLVHFRRSGSVVYYRIADPAILTAYDAIKKILKKMLEENERLVNKLNTGSILGRWLKNKK